MANLTIPDHQERQKLVKAARIFAPLLAEPDLSEDEIDASIEELRPVRMHIHAIDYGDAPGFQPKEIPDRY
jgi:hypothetical protein